MTYEIYEFEGCFFNDQFSLFDDSSPTIDILHSFQEHKFNHTPLLPSPPLHNHENIETTFDENDQITPTLLSTSPPSHQLGNLSLYHMGNSEAIDFSSLEVKTEERQLAGFDNGYYYGVADNALKMMQRSYSSNSFQFEKSNGVIYQPKFDDLVESSSVRSQILSSPDHIVSCSNMRRVCSTGDLQNPKIKQTNQRMCSSPLATESSLMEEANFKVGRYNAEERKEKIMKYRAKRTQRNFNKTIKYACRKTLADNRPRVRGRFARNDEPGENPKIATFRRYGDEDDIWMDGYHDEDYERTIGRDQFFAYPTIGQFQQFSFIRN